MPDWLLTFWRSVDWGSIGWSNWALVLVGLIGVRYAIKSLQALERQAKANEDTLAEIRAAGRQTDRVIEQAGKQAEAVLLNAQILRNAERPWILMKSQHIPDTQASGLIAKNCGRSPTQLVLSSKDN